jgi:hypothetical protein
MYERTSRGNTHFPFSGLNVEIADLTSRFLALKKLDQAQGAARSPLGRVSVMIRRSASRRLPTDTSPGGPP